MCIRKNSVDSEGVIYDRDQQYDSATNVENKSCNDIRETQVSNDELFNFADVEGEHNREEEDPLFSKSKSPYLNLADESRSSWSQSLNYFGQSDNTSDFKAKLICKPLDSQ